MNGMSSLADSISRRCNRHSTLSGAIDVVVVPQEDGSPLDAVPRAVRQAAAAEAAGEAVSITVNDRPSTHDKLGYSARFFVEDRPRGAARPRRRRHRRRRRRRRRDEDFVDGGSSPGASTPWPSTRPSTPPLRLTPGASRRAPPAPPTARRRLHLDDLVAQPSLASPRRASAPRSRRAPPPPPRKKTSVGLGRPAARATAAPRPARRNGAAAARRRRRRSAAAAALGVRRRAARGARSPCSTGAVGARERRQLRRQRRRGHERAREPARRP